MIEILINDKNKLKLPESWAEIIQLNKYNQVIACLYKDHATDEAQRIELFTILTGFDGYRLGKILKSATPAERMSKADEINFAFAMELKEKIFPQLDYIFAGPLVCPYPTLQINNTLLKAPGERIYDQTGHEMMLSHFSMTHYAESAHASHMNMLIAINYHIAIDGKRQKFNEELLDEIYKLIETVDFETKIGIYHWLCKCDEWWYEHYKHLFDGDELTITPTMEEQADTWRKLLLKLADNKMGADYDRVIARTRQDLFFLLDELDKEVQKKEIENFDK